MCGIGLVNKDDEHAPQIIKAANCELYTYSEESKEADFVASDIRYVSQPDFVGTEFHISGKYDMEVRLGIPGLFNVVNAWLLSVYAAFWDWIRRGSAMP